MTVLDNGGQVARAVESVLNQGFEDVELLCACSAEAVGARRICERFAERDIRMDVLPSAYTDAFQLRNAALERARGRYVTFCEAHGWFSPDALGKLARAAESQGCDLVLGGVCVDSYRGKNQELRSKVVSPGFGSPSRETFRSAAGYLVGNDLLCSLWGKLFVRERIEALGLRFEDVARSEVPFVLTYLRDAEHVSLCAESVYHHPEGSAAFPYRPDVYERYSVEYDMLLDLWRHWGFEGERTGLDAIHHRYIDQLVSCVEGICSKSCTLSSIEKRERIRDLVTSDPARRAAELSPANGSMSKPLIDPIRKGNADVCYMEGRILNLLGCTSKPSALVS